MDCYKELHKQIRELKDQIIGLWFLVIALIAILFGIALSCGAKITKLENEKEQKAQEVMLTTIPSFDSDAQLETDIETEEVSSPVKWQKFTATAYCGCAKCNGEWSDGVHAVSATGAKLTPSYSIAADFSVLPPFTTVEIKGMGLFQVHDCGGAIKGNRIDIFFSDHDQANEFGVQTVYLCVCDDIERS